MILPGLEEQKVYDSTQLPRWSTYLADYLAANGVGKTAQGRPAAGTALDNMRTSTLVCPSSPMPMLVNYDNTGGRIGSSYAAVAGASDGAFKGRGLAISADRCPTEFCLGHRAAETTRRAAGIPALGQTGIATGGGGAHSSAAIRRRSPTAFRRR